MRDLKLSDKGKIFIASFSDEIVTGKIQVEGKQFYLCQNIKNGSRCSDTLGYQYSWYVDSGSKYDISRNGVKDFKLLTPTDVETYKDFNKGDVLACRSGDGRTLTIDGKIGETLIGRFSSEYTLGGSPGLFTAEDLYKREWRLKYEPDEEDIVELSVSEVAEKLGIDPKLLKIVDNS